jgi:hypothetical protein
MEFLLQYKENLPAFILLQEQAYQTQHDTHVLPL